MRKEDLVVGKTYRWQDEKGSKYLYVGMNSEGDCVTEYKNFFGDIEYYTLNSHDVENLVEHKELVKVKSSLLLLKSNGIYKTPFILAYKDSVEKARKTYGDIYEILGFREVEMTEGEGL